MNGQPDLDNGASRSGYIFSPVRGLGILPALPEFFLFMRFNEDAPFTTPVIQTVNDICKCA